MMSTVDRNITATKAGIIEHLREHYLYQTSAVEKQNTLKERRFRQGYAEGLQFAIGVLEDWDRSEEPVELPHITASIHYFGKNVKNRVDTFDGGTAGLFIALLDRVEEVALHFGGGVYEHGFITFSDDRPSVLFHVFDKKFYTATEEKRS